LIACCATREDVAVAIEYARESGLDVAIRSGGHDVLGASVCDGAVIDLSPLKQIQIDAAKRTARVQAGVLSGELNTVAQRNGLAAALGCHPGVGVGGLVLGGGLGWLIGTQGAACDNLIGAEFITAEGRVLQVSEDGTPDLFWALRGGGGNFGIVTSLDIRLHAADQVLGGILVLRTEVASFLRFYCTFMQDAPDPLTVEITVLPGSPPVVIAIIYWNGDQVSGERILKPLRSFGTVAADWVEPVAYARLTSRMSDVGPLLGQSQGSGNATLYNYWRGGAVQELNDVSIGHIAQAILSAPEGCSFGVGHYMHGQVCRVPAGATPLLRRQGQATYLFSATWANESRADACMAWVTESHAALASYSTQGSYINYLSEDTEAAVKASYGTNYQRLHRIKRQYDPSNFFHHNRNIRPG
jgi:FAD/FMN-containing dehydrogenase